MAVKVDDLRKTVIESYKKGDWKACITACKELHKRNPGNVAITLKLADVFLKSKQKDNAVKAYLIAAETYKKNGDFLKAVGVYKMILNFAPALKEIEAKIEELCSGKDEEMKDSSLPHIPLLSELNEKELIEVVNSLKHLPYSMGEIICKDGDDGTSIYVITAGAVKVFIEGVAGEKIEIAQLKEGDFFGEAGFFTDGKRHASVMAIDDTELLEMRKEDVENIWKDHPHVKEVLSEFYKKRVLDKLLAVSPLFGILSDEDRKSMLASFNLKKYDEGSVVISEGEEGDAFYIIKNGKAAVTTTEGGEKEIKLAELKEGDFFGEVSLLTGKKRTATVKASTLLEVMELPKGHLKRCIDKYPKVEETLKDYMKARMEDTISTIMALKKMEAKEGLV
ncbi:MAG: cyclic nucleotide-binding domain-containing protein [Deltaproteobacteria bacterium]|nr:cyclic nucleotide-binding domain-containing protein [Deltaproteobacteria bacterium]